MRDVNKLYNEEVKERFLSQYDNEQTQITMRNVFYKTELVESVLGKDLYEFSLDELGKAIENTNPHTRNVAMSTGRFISQYITWAIEPPERIRKNALNPLKGVTSEFYDKLIDKTRKIHHSYEEFLELLSQLDNSQDAALLFLFWEGIIGERFSQIQALKLSDVNFDNSTIYVKERDEDVSVDPECLKYIEKANDEKTYYYYNMKTKEITEKELLPSEYIFKNVKSPRASENQMIGMSVIYNRIHTMKELLETEYLSPQSLRQSGMIWESVKQYQKDKVLAYDQLAEVGKKYDFSQITNNNYTYYNTFLMKEFVNESNISDLYNINLEIKLR